MVQCFEGALSKRIKQIPFENLLELISIKKVRISNLCFVS